MEGTAGEDAVLDEVRYRAEQRAEVDRLRAAHPWVPEPDCHAGWVGPLGPLCAGLEAIFGVHALSGDATGDSGLAVRVAFGREHGRLHAVVAGVPENKRCAVDALVRAAAAASARVCEVCGAAGNTRVHGGLCATRCGRHHAQLCADLAGAP